MYCIQLNVKYQSKPPTCRLLPQIFGPQLLARVSELVSCLLLGDDIKYRCSNDELLLVQRLDGVLRESYLAFALAHAACAFLIFLSLFLVVPILIVEDDACHQRLEPVRLKSAVRFQEHDELAPADVHGQHLRLDEADTFTHAVYPHHLVRRSRRLSVPHFELCAVLHRFQSVLHVMFQNELVVIEPQDLPVKSSLFRIRIV